MSAENVEIVRQVFGAEARRERRVLDALLDPAVVMDFSDSPFADFAQPRPREGLGEVRATFRDWYDAFEEVQADISELIDLGAQVVSVFTYRGTGRTSGVRVEFTDMAGLWTIRDRKIVGIAWLRTREHALAAAGRQK